MADFEKYYKLPLHIDKYGPYAWSENDTMSLMFDFGVKREDREKILKAINGKSEYRIENLTHKEHKFYVGKKYIFCVRGWGFLTGRGACNLPREKAELIQDAFIKHIYESLKQ